jgi:hypothetical protein
MSDSRNSSGVKPGRSSQSGSHPAAGGSRTRSAAVLDKTVVDDGCRRRSGAKATAVVVKLDTIIHFMLSFFVFVDRSARV